jgi:DNA polymerase
VSDKAARLGAIAADIDAHLPCDEAEICNEATNLVPGEGNPDADVVFVGEAPGASEDKQGRPFVGNAGRLLDGLLAEAGLEREQVFITNVVKARPPKNRDPKPAEVRHYLPWLIAQLEVIQPRLVVPLGRHPLAHFAPEAKISEVHGTVLETDERRLFPLYHPAAALHNPKLRETLVEDARALREAL